MNLSQWNELLPQLTTIYISWKHKIDVSGMDSNDAREKTKECAPNITDEAESSEDQEAQYLYIINIIDIFNSTETLTVFHYGESISPVIDILHKKFLARTPNASNIAVLV